MNTTTKARMRRPLNYSDPNPDKRKLFIATPCYGGMMLASHATAMQDLTNDFVRLGMPFEVCRFGDESLITRGRNRLVALFLESDCTDLLFVDADVGFVGQSVACLTMSNFDVVCAAYPIKNYAWQNIAQAVRSGCPHDMLRLAGAIFPENVIPKQRDGQVEVVQPSCAPGMSYVEIDDCATGFLLIRRRAVERFVEQYRREIEYTPDYNRAPDEKAGLHHQVFQAAIDPASPRELAARALLDAAAKDDDGSSLQALALQYRAALKLPPGRYLSEDYWFCRKWQQMGGKVYLSLDCRLTHTGMHTFVGDVGMMFEPVGEQPGKRPNGKPAPALEMVDPGEPAGPG